MSQVVSVSDKLKLELCHRGPGASAAFISVILLLFFFPLVRTEDFLLPFQAAAFLSIVISILRWYIGHRFQRESPNKILRTFPVQVTLIVLLSVTLCFLFALSFADSKNSPYLTSFAFMFAAGLFASSIGTLSYVPAVQAAYGFFQMWLPVAIACVLRYREDNIFGLFLLVNSVYVFYTLLGSRIFYRSVAKRFLAEESLQIEKQSLSEAYERLKQTQNELLQQKARAEYAEKMAALGQMAGGVAHEINSPLSVIVFTAELLNRDLKAGEISTSEASSMLEKIGRTAERIGLITRSLLFFSREGTRDPFQRFQLRHLIESTLALSRERFLNSQIKLQVDEFKDVTIVGREVQISQVLVNLLSNAFDAVVGSPDPWVHLGIQIKEDRIELSVENSGPLISPEAQKELFRPFFTTKEIGKGTGLGLSVSYGIVQEHGGKIFYDSMSPSTRFVCELPLREVKNA